MSVPAHAVADPAQRKSALPAGERLKISEVFYSLQGEAESVGWPTVFVRLTGCPLRCTWCDTAYAFHGGQWRSFDEIVAEVNGYGAARVCVTGGEPLAQANAIGLIRTLCDAGLQVSVETSGALPINEVDPRCTRVVDIKTPGSGEHERNLLDNLPLLGPNDQAKFVLLDRNDYEWARAFIAEQSLPERTSVLFSPVHGVLNAGTLADWMLEDRLPVRLQVQLHKLLWGDQRGR